MPDPDDNRPVCGRIANLNAEIAALMAKPKYVPCYRICTWDDTAKRWRPYVTRTRSLFRALRPLLRRGVDRRNICVEVRPGKGIPFPLPRPKGSELRLHA